MSYPGDQDDAEHTRPLGWSTPPPSGTGPEKPGSGGWGAPVGGPAGWGPPPPGAGGWGYPAGWAPPVQDHPQAITALVLGVVALAGGLMCWLPLLAAPFAWSTGSRALRDIRASGGQLGGEGQARAGQVMGMVGTALIALALVVLVVVVVIALTSSGGGTGSDYSNA